MKTDWFVIKVGKETNGKKQFFRLYMTHEFATVILMYCLDRQSKQNSQVDMGGW